MATRFLGSLHKRVGIQASNQTRFVRHASTSSVRPYLLNTPSAKVSKLSNGMRVVTEEWPCETASVGVFINAGSNYEDAKNNGVAHFLEHMAFKGTKTMPQKKLEVDIESMGAHLNAYTARDHTCYFAKAHKADTNKMVSILGDILQNSVYESNQVESERGTIIREAQEIENNTEEVLFDYLHSAAYQGTSLGRTILGTPENIRSIQRADLVNYIEKYYTGPRMVVAAAGAIKHEDLCAHVEKVFSGISKEDKHDSSRLEPIEFTGSEIRVRNDELPLVTAAIAVEGVSVSDADYFVLALIQSMVGNWDRTVGGGDMLASKLSEVVSMENLAHSYASFFCPYEKTSLFGVNFVAPPRRVDDLTFEILNDWQRIGTSATAKEIERAKNKLRTGQLLQLDGTTPVMENLGRNMLSLGRVMSIAEVAQRISDITAADVKRVATTYLTDVSPAVVAMGPTEFFPDYNTTRSWTYWNRM